MQVRTIGNLVEQNPEKRFWFYCANKDLFRQFVCELIAHNGTYAGEPIADEAINF